MALKPTIYKFNITLSDINRNYYDTLNLTLAQHPSETEQRLIARVLSFCINAQDNLSFTKGLSEVDEPALWVKTLDGQTALWIDVGEPSVDRIKKATHAAQRVIVYSFNSKSDVWWDRSKDDFGKLHASVFRLNAKDIEQVAGLLQRTMEMAVTINGDTAHIAAERGECEVHWELLQQGLQDE